MNPTLFRNTSQYPEAEVYGLVKQAVDFVGVRFVAVAVKNCNNGVYRGWAYSSVPTQSPFYGKVNYLITARVGSPGKFPADNTTHTTRWFPKGISEEEARAMMGRMRGNFQRELTTQTWYEYPLNRPVVETVQYGAVTTHPYGGISSPAMTMRTWQEGLLTLIAHEAQHIKQYQKHLPASEVEAEWTAYRCLNDYRRLFSGSGNT